ncbi:family 43 glycosylhydrolase [Clostridium bowmanii]|uniref:family 43 glycosylhydrolase n=1 Tax=Clostridium bowmanii TaxID=132925 RepID=UPI001C0E8A6A|nr:family 43 glycosylhydrolase [Clostridium bowmanii]MBU3189677.1 family 43 glycosylhydrolase [Clostridium bowmanii]MCA1073477.1 family 43 glycosylhydrolase [Clostridium bowmanii]
MYFAADDGTVLKVDKDSLYFVWSGWEGDKNGKQNLYIAAMSNPFTISGERVLMSTPEYDWEKMGMPINEGPQVLVKEKNIMIVYSASGSWAENYCLGLLVNNSKDILNSKSWIKKSQPVFKGTVENKSFGVGHGSFVKSPSGKDDW